MYYDNIRTVIVKCLRQQKVTPVKFDALLITFKYIGINITVFTL